MSDLTLSQKAVVESTAERIYVIAGPGSGKTHTLVSRIVHRVANGLVRPERIAMITFTNAAAKEMAHRLAQHEITVGFVGTLHAFLIAFLQAYGHRIGYRRSGVTIITEEESDKILADLILRFNYRLSLSTLRKRRDRDEEKLIWGEYAHFLKRNNLVDYDTVLTAGLKLFGPGDFTLGHVTAKEFSFRELYVDEVQDSGEEDWKIFVALPMGQKTYFGDPDQSIYSFRGGKPEIFTSMASLADSGTLDGSVTFRLEESFRCAPAIAEEANRLIAHNIGRIPKVIIPASFAFVNNEGDFRKDIYSSEREEIGNISKLIHQTGSPESCAVLAPTNRLADRAGELLQTAGWEIAKTKQAKCPLSIKAMNLLFYAADPDSEYRASGLSLTATETVPASPAMLLPWLGQFLDKVEIEFIAERIKAANPGATISDIVHDIREHSHETELEVSKGVTVCTIHAAKGREWDHVFVIGLEAGTLPRKGHDIEEARRLLFVAMTRARLSLAVSCALTRRAAYGVVQSFEPSPFLL